MTSKQIRFWCYKVLPLVYDDSLSYYELLCKVVSKINEIIETDIGFNVADPIEWNITSQYPQNTLVVDSDGTAYISKQAVPSGVDIHNTEYWQSIFNYGDVINSIRENIATNTGESGILTENTDANSLVWYKGDLYKLTTDLAAGSLLIPDTNCTKITVEEWTEDLLEAYEAQIEQSIDEEIAIEAQAREEADNNLQQQIDNLPVFSGNDFIEVGMPVFGRSASNLSDSSGMCLYAKLPNGKTILFDLGYSGFFNVIESQLVEAGANDIYAIVISHYHGDHYSDPSLWAQSTNINTDDAILYLPLPTTNYAESYSAMAAFENAFPNNTKIYPTESSQYAIADTGAYLKFYNCGEGAISYYDTNYPDDYNSYCMVCELIYKEDRATFTADINDISINRIVSNGLASKTNFITIPHHGVNDTLLADDYCRITSPSLAFIANNNVQLLTTGYRSPMIAYLCAMGCDIFTQIGGINKKCFFMTGSGITQPNMTKLVIDKFAPEYPANIYVDGTTTNTVLNGNQNTPYNSLVQAVDSCGGFDTIIHASNITRGSIQLNYKKNIKLIIDNTCNIDYIIANNSENITIEQWSTNGSVSGNSGVILNNCSRWFFDRCTINNISSVTVTDSNNINFTQLTINKNQSTDYLMKFVRSNFTINTIYTSTTYTKAIIKCELCTGSALFNFTDITTGAGISVLHCVASHIYTGRQIAAQNIVQGTYYMDSSSEPIFFYNLTTNKPSVLLNNGTIVEM